MKSKRSVGKRAVLGIFILGIVLVSIIAVSAGWTDIFKFGSDKEGLEGELNTNVPAAVKVQSIDPPKVVYVSDVSGPGSTTNSIKPLIKTAGNTSVIISFIAQQGNTVSDLNSPLAFKGVTFNRASESPRLNLSCSGTQITCTLPLCGNTGTAMNFSCNVSMNYYDGNGTWIVNATVVSPTYGVGSNLTKTFSVEPSAAGAVFGTYLNWTSSSLSVGSTDILSNNNLTVENYGNIPYSLIQVNATDLNGTVTPGEYIPANKFEANACAVGVTLGKDTNPTITTFTAAKALWPIDLPAGKTTPLPFCISLLTSPSGLTSQEYNTALTRQWIITAP